MAKGVKNSEGGIKSYFLLLVPVFRVHFWWVLLTPWMLWLLLLVDANLVPHVPNVFVR